MAKSIHRPRPATRLGLSSDVRSGSYQTRDGVKSDARQGAKSRVPAKARTGRPVITDRRVPR
jgi:hypothetical protein